jgi:hypothetical protein
MQLEKALASLTMPRIRPQLQRPAPNKFHAVETSKKINNMGAGVASHPV